MKNIKLPLWLASVFLAVFGSKLLLIRLFGSALPWWDQWAAEGWQLYIPYLDGTLGPGDFFVIHCEHRAVVNRVLSLLTLILNGQWDARLGMILNAAFTAATGTFLSWVAWKLLERRHMAAVCAMNILVFSLPVSWESTVHGLMGNYFLAAFALAAVWFMTASVPFRPAWLLGLFFALLGLLTLGAGFFGALAVVGVVLLRFLARAARPRLDLAALACLLPLVAAGFFMREAAPGHDAFMPASAAGLLAAFLRNMAWPFIASTPAAAIAWFPVGLLFLRYLFIRDDARAKFEFVLGFGLWVALQAAALAFARYGILASRHAVILSLSLPVNFLALLLLLRDAALPAAARKALPLVLVAWLAFAGSGLWNAARGDSLAPAAAFKQHLIRCEENVRSFLQTGDMACLANKPLYDIPFPNPDQLALVLRHPGLSALLPVCVNESARRGPLTRCADVLLARGKAVMSAGFALVLALGLLELAGALFRGRTGNGLVKNRNGGG